MDSDPQIAKIRKRRFSQTDILVADSARSSSGDGPLQQVHHEDAPAPKYANFEVETICLTEFCDEILLNISNYLDSWSLLSLMQTCMRFRHLMQDHQLWTTVDLIKEPLPLGMLETILEYTSLNTHAIKIRGPPPAQHTVVQIKQFNETLLRTFSEHCTQLQVLELRGITLDFSFFSINKLPRTLKRLVLNDCNVSLDPGPYKPLFKNIDSHLLDLEELAVENNNWFDPQYLMIFSKINNLRWLSLRGCEQLMEFVPYGSIAARFGFRKLEFLDLRHTPINDSDLQCFNSIITLKEILLESMSVPRLDKPTPARKINLEHDMSDTLNMLEKAHNMRSIVIKRKSSQETTDEAKPASSAANSNNDNGGDNDLDTKPSTSAAAVSNGRDFAQKRRILKPLRRREAYNRLTQSDPTYEFESSRVIWTRGPNVNESSSSSASTTSGSDESEESTEPPVGSSLETLPMQNGEAAGAQLNAIPKQEIDIAPQENGVAPAENAVASQENGVVSKENAVTLQENGVDPQENGVAPQENGVAPQENGFVPRKICIVPQENGIAPPENDVAPQENGIAAQANDAAQMPLALPFLVISIREQSVHFQNHNNNGRASNYPQRPPTHRPLGVQQVDQALYNHPVFWDMMSPLRRSSRSVRIRGLEPGSGPSLRVRSLRLTNRQMISDRGICCFGRAARPVDHGVVWIRLGDRPNNNRIERLTVRNYERVTDNSLRHLVQCSPHLVYLDVTGTSVSVAGITEFMREKPDCKVVVDHLQMPQPEAEANDV